MQLISIAQKDMYSKVFMDPITKRYKVNQIVFSDFTTVDDLDEGNVFYWPEENEGKDLLPGYALFTVGETGMISLVREEPLHAKA